MLGCWKVQAEMGRCYLTRIPKPIQCAEKRHLAQLEGKVDNQSVTLLYIVLKCYINFQQKL